jgi:hypothetical protein
MSKKTHEEVLNITDHEWNANQIHINIPPQEWQPSRTQTTTNVGQDVGENESSNTAVWNVN